MGYLEKLEAWALLMRHGPVAKALIITTSLMIGYVAGKIGGRAIDRGLGPRLARHQAMIARRAVFYLILALCLLTGFNEAGINLSVLIGAAGVLSVAIGFASQTTMSNLISGIFLLIERPFLVGDVIKIGATTGEVTSIGLISTLLKTPENTMVRIPNESLMKSEITNTTKFSYRKVEVQLLLRVDSNMDRVRELILSALSQIPQVKKTPKPQVVFKSFQNGGVLLAVEYCLEREDIGPISFLVAESIKGKILAEGIPFVVAAAPIQG